MKSRQWLAVAAVVVVALSAAACGSSNKSSSSPSSSSSSGGSSAGGTVNGAGSTLAQPIYQQWGSELKGKNVTLNYQGVGSGAGVASFAAGTADFAASDPPLTPDDIKTLTKGTPVQIPTVFGAITVSYNLAGVNKGLKLDGKTVADIYLGKVKKWNDPEIAGQNSGVSLPSSNITVVHRSDSSGTTKGFTTFLSNYSPEWKSKVGADKDVKWPLGTGAKGNPGVAAAVKQTPGAIGYVEEAYALQNNFTTADVKNKSGNYIAPSLESTTAAGVGLTIPADLGFTAIDAPGAQAYPIVSQTFIDVYQDLCKGGMSKANAEAFKTFINYGLGAGQNVAKQLFYAPLPPDLLTKAQAQVAKLQCNGAAL
ncbi:MAG: phosphate ABC transporter substrate-binding protein PstS [Thermoleophilaceae bacterium]